MFVIRYTKIMLHKTYTFYISFIFILVFLVTYPLQLVLIQFESTKKTAHLVNYWNIKLILFLSFLKIEITGKKQIKKNQKYIFCSNHSSFIDIPSLFILKHDYIKFVGKASISKIPLFGYMYNKLYITVNRRDKESRKKVYEDCRTALKNNQNIAIYPEGAIPHITPEMIPFKDGAFKLSIEENTPILPITLPFNHLVLPVDKFIVRSRHIKIVIHSPLNTLENPIADYKELKEKTYNIINDELKKHNVV